MPKIMAIDQAKWSGYAWGEPGSVPKSGVYKAPKTNGHPGEAPTSMETWLMEVIRQNEIDAVYYEEPILGTKGNHTFQTMALRFAWPTVIATATYKCGVSCEAVPITTWRSIAGVRDRPTKHEKRVHGLASDHHRRRWIKDNGMARCRALGFTVKSYDEADAVLIWWAMCQRQKTIAAQGSLPLEESIA